jgi:hypothetical protein
LVAPAEGSSATACPTDASPWASKAATTPRGWGRAEWPALGGRALFTADLTKPFEVVDAENRGSGRITFDVISLWEVLEHIHERDLTAVFDNILRHMEAGGLVITSISSEVLEHHQAVRDETWWTQTFCAHGLTPVPGLVRYFATQFIRGPRYNAPGSFHVIATNDPDRAPAVPPMRIVAHLLDRIWYGTTPYRQGRRFLGIE